MIHAMLMMYYIKTSFLFFISCHGYPTFAKQQLLLITDCLTCNLYIQIIMKQERMCHICVTDRVNNYLKRTPVSWYLPLENIITA